MHSPRGMLLIVDDDGGAAGICAGVLRLEGYDVVTACGTEGGWRAIAANRPDAILLDLAMPVVDQVLFLRRLRAHRHVCRIPIAVLTAGHFVDDHLVELDLLNAVVCFKPVWQDDLVRITEQLLRGTP
jgi:DNA-binding response OmpR family regulator